VPGQEARSVLVTHATQYTGPGAVAALRDQGMRVFCHDLSFGDASARAAYAAAQPGTVCLAGTDPDAVADELDAAGIALDALVSNDAFANTPAPVEALDLDELRRSFEALLVFPVHLARRLLPGMKARGAGSFVFVTSARPLRPEPGFAVPTSIRAGATAFALALSREVASFGIQVNVVAPNYLYSEMYYPRARFIDDPEGRAQIAAAVPMGRLGTPREVGELIAFLASGRAGFVTGQTIHFTGGWP
jgi:NAD(P)-dependent dehydrogenase (short-subunit alcohol dehydrogenase family)